MNNTHQQKPKISVSITKHTSNVLKVENLTFSYNQREDRILFIINHMNIEQRIDFFVTRRLFIKLLNAFDDILIKYCNNGEEFKNLYHNQKELVVSKVFTKKEKTKKEEKKDTYWEKSVNTKDLNFTRTKEPIILDSLSYSISSNNIITLKFISENKIYAMSTMDSIMFQRTLSSMMRVVPFVAWGISPNILD